MTVAAPLAPWPPQCCVPAFVQASLAELGIACPPGPTLARALGVRVGRDQENPLNLPVATPSEPTGVSAARAERKIDLLFRGLGASVRFRHVPLMTITFGCWEEVLREAREKGAVVGVGVDYGRLIERDRGPSALHVLRIVANRGATFSVRDDSGEATHDWFDVDAERLWASVLAIPDGLWVVGPEECMSLRLTLPWSAHT